MNMRNSIYTLLFLNYKDTWLLRDGKYTLGCPCYRCDDSCFDNKLKDIQKRQKVLKDLKRFNYHMYNLYG